MTITWSPPEPAVIVDAPAREAYDFGLFSVIDFGEASRGSVPIVWDSQGCLVPEAVRDACLHGADPHTKQSTIVCGDQWSTGFSVYAMDKSSLGRTGVDNARATTQLEYAEQVQVERYLLMLLDEHSTVVTPVDGASPYTPLIAVALIEQALSSRGGKGTIIMSRYLATVLSDHLVANGGRLTTKLGTPVVAIGAEYDTPADALAVYGVTSLKGIRGTVATSTEVDREINDLSAVAERDYSLGFECDAFVALATTA
jgi:hypothetical protein